MPTTSAPQSAPPSAALRRPVPATAHLAAALRVRFEGALLMPAKCWLVGAAQAPCIEALIEQPAGLPPVRVLQHFSADDIGRHIAATKAHTLRAGLVVIAHGEGLNFARGQHGTCLQIATTTGLQLLEPAISPRQAAANDTGDNTANQTSK